MPLGVRATTGGNAPKAARTVPTLLSVPERAGNPARSDQSAEPDRASGGAGAFLLLALEQIRSSGTGKAVRPNQSFERFPMDARVPSGGVEVPSVTQDELSQVVALDSAAHFPE